MKRIVIFAMLLSLVGPAIAKVNPSSVPDVLTEESELIITGTKLSSKGNPIKASVITADGQTVELTITANSKATKASVILPKIPSGVGNIVKLVLRLSGGDITSSSPQEFLTVLLTRPSNFVADLPSSTSETAPTLPSNLDTGAVQVGPQGAQGAKGDTGTPGAQGGQGSQGLQGPVPTSYPGANITGSVASAVSFTGALAGDVTGTQLATAISDATVFGKKLSGVYTAGAGTVTNGDSLKAAVQKLDGNIAANSTSISNVNGNLLANTVVLNAATNSNTASTIVKRDASGNFSAGTITANLTGNASGSAASFTGALSGDVTGNQSSTAIASSVVLGKTLSGYVADNGTVADGDSIFQAIQNLDGNITDNSTKIQINKVAIGAPTATNTPSEIVKRDASGNFAAGVVTAVTFVGNLSGSVDGLVNHAVQPAITTTAGLTSIGTTAIPTTIKGPLVANEGISGTFTGTVNGNLNGQVLVANQTSIARLNALTKAGTSGVRTTFFGPVNGAEGFIGNLTGNSAGVHTGNVIGNVTGDVTGNVSGSAASFTTSLSGDVTGTQSATVIADATVSGKKLSGIYAAAAGTVTNGDSIKAAVQKLDGNIAANTARIASVNGNVLANAASIASVNGNVLANTASIVAIATGLTPIAVAGAALDVDTFITFSVTGVNLVEITDSDISTNDTETITTITGGVSGQRLTLIMGTLSGTSADIIFSDGGVGADTLNLNGPATLSAGDVLELIYYNGYWHEVSRSDN